MLTLHAESSALKIFYEVDIYLCTQETQTGCLDLEYHLRNLNRKKSTLISRISVKTVTDPDYVRSSILKINMLNNSDNVSKLQ